MFTLESSTDTPEQVTAANGDAGATEETKPSAAADTEKNKPAAESAADPESAEDPQESKPEKKKGGYQRRIDQLTAEKRELERRLADKPAAKPEEKQADPAPAPADKPKSADFNTYDDYVEALTDWKAEQKEVKRTEAAKAKEVEAKQAEVKNAWDERAAAAKSEYEDYEDVLGQDLQISAAMQAYLLDSELGPHLAYTLGSDVEECERIAKLSPIAAVRELTKLELKLSGERAGKTPETKETPKPKVSAAPAPIKPVGSKSSATTKAPDEMSHEEYRAWRERGGGR